MNDLMLHDPRDEQIADLTEEVGNLRAAVARANTEAAQAQQDANRALSALRRQLSPLYKALQAVFGELDTAGVEDETAAFNQRSPRNERTAAIWESWKSRMPGGPAKIIDALLLQSDMNTQQLAIATGVHRNSIPAMIYKLNKAGLLNKNGGRFSVKQL